MSSIMASFRLVLVSVTKDCVLLQKVGNSGASLQQQIRRWKSSVTKALSRNLTFVKSSRKDMFKLEERPLVLIYSWLLAKNNHIQHYSQIYDERGFDVLQIKVAPQDVLWPRFIQKKVEDISGFLISRTPHPIVIHGFSVGGFVHMEVINYLLNKVDQSERGKVFQRLKGQVFDSVVDVAGVAEGVSTALFLDWPILQRMTKASISGYLSVMDKPVTAIHRRSSEMFFSNPLRVPTLMLYSKSDPIGSAGPIESAINCWQKKGIPVTAKCWDNTTHVGHFRVHKDEYIACIDNFLESIGLKKVEVTQSVCPQLVVQKQIPPTPPSPFDIPVPVAEVSKKAFKTTSNQLERPVKRKIFASNKPAL